MRTRVTSTGSFDQRATYLTSSYGCDGQLASQVITESKYGVVSTKVTRDTSTPGFAQLKKVEGILPFNPFSVESSIEQRIPIRNSMQSAQAPGCRGSYAWTTNGFSVPGYGFQTKIPDVPDVAIVTVVNSAAAKARSGAWDALTFAGEFRDTYRMFKKAGKALKDWIDYTKRRSPIDTTKPLLEHLSSAWLTYRYGIMPLLYDLEDMRKALDASLEPVRVRERSTLKISDSYSHEKVFEYPGEKHVLRETTTYTHTVRGWGLAEVRVQNAITLDPVRTAYELTRLSFVLDWFVDYGTYLEAISPFANGDLVSSGYSIQTSAQREISFELVPGPGVTGSFAGLYKTLSINNYSRSPRSPSLPGFYPQLNVKRVTDAAALAYSILIAARRK